MYQTRGLFYPSLSQRVYQSNQSLKLAAKAAAIPKGSLSVWNLPDYLMTATLTWNITGIVFSLLLLPPFLCFSPHTPSRPRLLGTRCSSPGTCPALLGLPVSPRCRCLGAAVRSGRWRRAACPRMRADRPCPCQLHPCLRQFRRVRWGIWTMLKTTRCCWQALDGGACRACCQYFSLTGGYVLL